MTNYHILRVISKLLIPFIFLFALYVQFHGDYSPGGGFQAGVIIAAAFILHALIFGLEAGRRLVPGWVNLAMLAGGVIVYGGVGVAGASCTKSPVEGRGPGLFHLFIGALDPVLGAGGGEAPLR